MVKSLKKGFLFLACLACCLGFSCSVQAKSYDEIRENLQNFQISCSETEKAYIQKILDLSTDAYEQIYAQKGDYYFFKCPSFVDSLKCTVMCNIACTILQECRQFDGISNDMIDRIFKILIDRKKEKPFDRTYYEVFDEIVFPNLRINLNY